MAAIRSALRLLAIVIVADCLGSQIRRIFQRQIPADPPSISDPPAYPPYQELVGPISPQRWQCPENFTESGRHALAQARLQAYAHRSDHVGTEHVLLALVDGQHDPLVRVLRGAGVTAGEVRDRIEEAIGPTQQPRATHLPYSPHVKRALATSLRQAEEAGRPLIDVEHIVDGLFSQPDSAAARFIADLGIDPAWVSHAASPTSPSRRGYLADRA